MDCPKRKQGKEVRVSSEVVNGQVFFCIKANVQRVRGVAYLLRF